MLFVVINFQSNVTIDTHGGIIDTYLSDGFKEVENFKSMTIPICYYVVLCMILRKICCVAKGVYFIMKGSVAVMWQN